MPLQSQQDFQAAGQTSHMMQGTTAHRCGDMTGVFAAGNKDDSMPIHGCKWEWEQGTGHQVHRLVPEQRRPCSFKFMGRGSQQPISAGTLTCHSQTSGACLHITDLLTCDLPRHTFKAVILGAL